MLTKIHHFLSILYQLYRRHPLPGLLLLLALFTLLAITISWLFSPSYNKNSTANDPKKTYTNLTINKSTHQDIINKLGAPLSVYQNGEYTVYTYTSTTSYYSPDQLYLKDNILIAKEVTYTPYQYKYTQSTLIQKYGQPNFTLYQSATMGGQLGVYFYQQKGIAAFIDLDQNLIYKIIEFPPISLDAFRNSWGKGLLDTRPTPAPSTVNY